MQTKVPMGVKLSDYLTQLLRAFHKHRGKFCLTREDFNRISHHGPQKKNLEAHRLHDDRLFFETGFVRLISIDCSDDSVIQLLPAQKMDELRGFFLLLNKLANPEFKPAYCDPKFQAEVRTQRLYRLEQLIAMLDQSEGPFDLASGTKSSLFIISGAEAGAARSAVQKAIHILDSMQSVGDHGIRQPAIRNIGAATKTTDPADSFIQFFDQEYRAFVSQILDTVSIELNKCPPVSGHKIMIQLPNIRHVDISCSSTLCLEESLDVFLFCPELSQWHSLRCKFDRECQSKNREYHRLCHAVKIAFKRGEGLLILFDKVIAAFSESPQTFDLPTVNPNKYPIRNLRQLITVDNLFNPPPLKPKEGLFNHIERRELAVKLALHLLIFCSSVRAPTTDSWEGSHISFFSSSNSLHDCNRESPYFSCRVGRDVSSSGSFMPGDEGNPVKTFTDFARLLMEIEYGPIDDLSYDFSPKNDYGWGVIRDCLKSRRSFNDISRTNYLEAVSNCLHFDRLFRRARLVKSGKNETPEDTCRRIIRTEILRKILIDMPNFQEQLPKREAPPKYNEHLLHLGTDSAKARQDTNSDRDDGHYHNDFKSFPTLTGTTYEYSKTAMSIRSSASTSSAVKEKAKRSKRGMDRLSMIPRLSRDSKIPKLHPAVSFQEPPRLTTGSLFDSQTSRIPPETATSAKKWLKTLHDRTHPIIDCGRRPADVPVKVAVLDTGVDTRHPAMQRAIEQNLLKITKFQNWCSSPYGISDRIGHGTAVCDILLQIAKVDLYVGKVSDTAEFDEQTAGRVAKAIRHAISLDGWNVDIIVLSLGFQGEDEGIRLAVQDAFTSNKIVFAAASNSGSIIPDGKVSYPARIHGQVISIRSATGYSTRSSASPLPSDGDDNFMILGEGLEAAWPIDLNEGHLTRYVSGSSFATPVAAGIAALVLEFSIQKSRSGFNVPGGNKSPLWTYRGIRKMFQNMSTIDDQRGNADCRMIYPWKFFDPNRHYEGCRIEINRLLQTL